jgi:monoamine oxidase
VALRWFALSGWDARLIHDAAGRYKFADGTRSLIDAMVADGRPDIQLSSPVAGVEHGADGATVTTRDGSQVSARAVVMSAPLNTWTAMTFSPALSAGKQAAAAEGQASRGTKVFVRVRGIMQPFFGVAPDTHGISSIGAEYFLPGATVLVGFGPAADRLDVTDRAAVAAAVHEFLPDAVVEDVAGHDWVADEFSRGTWPVFRPGQLSRYLRALQEREGCLFMAGSELANGWSGFIDGAIETGLTAGREVAAYLGRPND